MGKKVWYEDYVGADAKTVEPIKPVIQIDEKNDAEKN